MKKRKLNLLDYALILLVVALVGLGVYKQVSERYLRYDAGAEAIEMSDRMFTYRVEDIRSMSVEAVVVGDSLYDLDTNTLLGTIVAYDDQPYTEWVMMDNGNYVEAEVPGRHVLYITVEGPVLETDSKYLANGVFELKVHSDIRLATQKVGFSGRLAWFD